MTESTGERQVTWPCERFYWGVIDASILRGRAGRSRERLGYLFEPLVPQPLEEVHAIFHPLGGRRFLACGIDRTRLDPLLAGGVVRLTPAKLPPFIEEKVDPARLNLLTGQFTPPAVQALERRWQALAAGLLAASLLLVAVGLERRAAAAEERTQELAREAQDLVHGALGPSSLYSSLPLPLQLEAELRRLRRTRSSELPVGALDDAAMDLRDLLSAWPRELPIETDSVHVTDRSIHVQGRVTSSGDAQVLADSLGKIEGWRPLQPTLQALPSGVRATIQLQREEAPVK